MHHPTIKRMKKGPKPLYTCVICQKNQQSKLHDVPIIIEENQKYRSHLVKGCAVCKEKIDRLWKVNHSEMRKTIIQFAENTNGERTSDYWQE